MSVRFDAETDRISITTTLPALTTGITITGWFYLSVDRDTYSALFWAGAAGGSAVQAETDADGTTLWSFNGGGSINSGVSMSTGTWYRVAMRQNNTTGTLFIASGLAGSTVATSGTQNNITPDVLHVGGRPSSGEWWNGRAAQVRVFASALTQAEIETEWASPTAVLTTWANWPLDVASNLNDSSGNARHLTAGSTAVTTEADPPNVSSGTTATAGLASGTGAALAPMAKVTTNAGVAAGTGAALAPAARVTAVAGVAAGTGAALGPTAKITAVAGVASGTGAALGPVANVATPAGLASGAGAALSPTASTASATTASAGVASGSGAALSPSVRLTVPAGLASGTGAALNPTASTAASTTATPGVASGTGTALAPVARVTAAAGVAAGSGAALAPSVALTAPAGLASGTGAALNPSTTSVPAVTANAGVASGVGVARSPIVRLVVMAGVASGSGVALAPAASDGTPPVVIASMRAVSRRAPEMAGAVRAGPTSRRSSS